MLRTDFCRNAYGEWRPDIQTGPHVMRRFVTLALIAACLLAAPAAADSALSVEVRDFGIYHTRADKRVPHPNSATGEMNIISHLRFIRKTKKIAAQLGRSFGWRYRLLGLPDNARVTFRTLHPPITNPATGQTKTSSWRTIIVRKPNDLRYTGYTFDYMWELAEGRWAFQVMYDGKVIGEQSFNVVVPLN